MEVFTNLKFLFLFNYNKTSDRTYFNFYFFIKKVLSVTFYIEVIKYNTHSFKLYLLLY